MAVADRTSTDCERSPPPPPYCVLLCIAGYCTVLFFFSVVPRFSTVVFFPLIMADHDTVFHYTRLFSLTTSKGDYFISLPASESPAMTAQVSHPFFSDYVRLAFRWTGETQEKEKEKNQKTDGTCTRRRTLRRWFYIIKTTFFRVH